MPILGLVAATNPADTGTTDTGVVPQSPFVALNDIGTIAAWWIDADGTVWPLTNNDDRIGWFTVNGPAGWGAGSIELVTDTQPRGGEQVRFIHAKSRRIQWPLHIYGDTHDDFNTRYRSIMRAFTKTTQRRAPGWLRVARADGGARQIACYYEQGFEGTAGQNWVSATPTIQLYCPDGYWQDIAPATPFRAQFTGSAAAAANFFSPFMTVASSQIASGGTNDPPMQIFNPGDIEAWPVWTITGPMSGLVAASQTTGTQFTLTYTLKAGETITITTNRPTVRGPGNVNLSNAIDWFNPAGTELWPLEDGANSVKFTVNGAAAGTSVTLAYTPRYETC